MIKLKDILSEAYAWERQEGKPLPTLAEVQAAYDARMLEDAGNEDPDYIDLDDEEEVDDDGYPVMDGGRPSGSSREVDDDKDPEPEKWSTDKLEKEPDDPFDTDLYDDDDDDGYYMDESAKPDFLDLDGDGDETESMKSAAADSTPHGNYVNKSRAKSHLTKKDGIVHGINGSGKSVKLTSPSDVDKVDDKGKPEYTKFTIKSNDDLLESFNKRILGNLHGHEYILGEAFKRK